MDLSDYDLYLSHGARGMPLGRGGVGGRGLGQSFLTSSSTSSVNGETRYAYRKFLSKYGKPKPNHVEQDQEQEQEEEDERAKELEHEVLLATRMTEMDRPSSATKIRLHRTGSVDISIDSDGNLEHGEDEELRREVIGDDRRSSRLDEVYSSVSSSRHHPPRGEYLNESFHSRHSAGSFAQRFANGSTRSAAVISAMDALQEKARRAEMERDMERDKRLALQAEMRSIRDEACQAMESLENRVIELEELLAESKGKIQGLEQTLSTRDGELKESREQLERMCVLEAKLQEKENRIEDLTGKLDQERRAIQDIQHKHKQELSTHENRYQELEKRFEYELVQRQDLEKQRLDSEDFIRGLMELNQSLVEKMAHHKQSQQQKQPSKRVGKKKKTTSSVTGSINVASSKMSTHSEATGSRRSQLSLDKELVQANLGKPVPFLLGKNPGPSFSIYAQAQQNLSDDQAFGAGFSAKEPQRTLTTNDEDDESEVSSSASWKTPPKSQHSFDRKMIQASEVEIKTLMNSLKAELDELTATYESELRKAASEDIDKLANGLSAEKSRELSALVEKIEEKAQQLYMLQKYRSTMNESRGRSPVRSPKAYDKKVNTLRALSNFRKLSFE